MLRITALVVVCLIIAYHSQRDSAGPESPLTHTVEKVVVDPAAVIPTADQFIELARTNPVECVRAAIVRSQKEIQGYTCTLLKRERLGGKLNPLETIEITYRAEPHSVVMKWLTEPTGQADRVLYVQGANGDQMLVRPKSALARAVAGAVVSVDPEGREARAGGRVTLREFGMKKGAERLLAAWTQAKNDGTLQTEFQGVKPVAELDGRQCILIQRTITPPDEENIHTAQIGFDAENWQTVSTVLKDDKGQLVASYYFKDLKLNPEFAADRFEKSVLK